jgi:hypothetical protein
MKRVSLPQGNTGGIMKHLRNVFGILLILSLAFLQLNCEQKSSTGPTTPSVATMIGEVQLTGDPELYAVQGQSASTTLTATVTDTSGDAVQGVEVKFSTPTFGSVSTDIDTTDEEGNVIATFNSQGEFGLALVRATVTAGGVEHSDTLTIGVYELAGLPYDLYLAVEPSVLYLSEGQNGQLTASVVVFDSLGVGLPGIQVSFETTLGSIEIAGTTGSDGGLSTNLQTLEQFGMGIVTASVLTSIPDTSEGSSSSGPETKEEGDRKSDDLFVLVAVDTFYVNPFDDRIAGISVSASPANLFVSPGTIDSCTIRATVVDEFNVGVAGVPISFRTTTLGILSSDAGTTDNTGSKSVTFYSVPNEPEGVATVWAEVSDLVDSTTVTINQSVGATGRIILSTDSYLIYADNGITTANLTALLQDADYQVIRNVEVIFTSDYGSVNSPVMTDSAGIANALFRDIGFTSYPDSTTIIAKYPTLNVSDTVRVMIAPALDVDFIQLNSATTSMQANGLDSSRVDAIIYLENGTLAPQGTEVHFLVEGESIGDISPTIATITEAGTATSWYRTGITVGIDTLYAVVQGVYSNGVAMHLNPGPPSHVNLSVDESTVSVNSTTPIEVTATVTDTTGNPVEDDEGVYFTASLGSIYPPQVPTLGGEAITELLPGTTAGQSWIKAQVGTAIDSILVTFTPIDPAYISLSADYTAIAISPGGDTTFTPIHAHVKDASGNYVGNGIVVHFEIVNGFPGGGVNINNHGIEDSTVTSGGIASVVLNAGENPGPVQIRAWTYNDEQIEISAQQALVTIVSGPPANIDINFMSDPVTGGGDVWNIEVSALVEDDQGNQVPNGVSVSFLILPDTIAEIQGDAVTGNENWDGNTQPGVAFTTLAYHSDEIFEEVTVLAYTVTGEDTITGSQDKILPLDANGTLTLTVSPIAWNFTTMPPPSDPAIMEMRTVLKDGHQNHVNGGTILFQSPKGRAFRYSNEQGATWLAITGPEGFTTPPPPEQQDSTGIATLWLLTTFEEAFPDPSALITTAQITAVLLDYGDITASPQTVEFQHNLTGGGGDERP